MPDEGGAEERDRRIGLNEAVFREVNERLEELANAFDLPTLDLICECGDENCDQRISMSVEEYEDLRSEATQFAVVPGHAILQVDRMVERREGYDVVAKRSGEPAEVARRTDPRS